ncbi:MAG: hypothetical protein JWM11_2189, partial [Planctomycetaceae bacterium]|nr:hypothetical protein [Planctomycetaceae bacterium]
GWHALTCQFSSATCTISIDGDLLTHRHELGGMAQVLKCVEFAAEATSSPVWIDDFCLFEAATTSQPPRLQSTTDEVILQTGDELFGSIREIDLDGIRLDSEQREARIPWSQLSRVCLADAEFEPRAVSGWICRINLQPLWTAPDWRLADTLHCAIVSCDVDHVDVEHSILDRLSIPLEQIRQIKPAYFGVELELEGRDIHLGDEVKSRFRTPVPCGTQWKRRFQLDSASTGRVRLRVRARNLEPSGPETRPTPLLNRLRSGELTTELHLNQKRIAILNEHLSGHGTEQVPQEILLNLSAESLRKGENLLEIQLKPSRDEVPEYDDWELFRLTLELESNPVLGPTP